MPIEIRLLKESEYLSANDFYNQTSHINRAAPITARSSSEFEWEFMDCPNGKAIYASAWESEDGKESILVGIQSMILLKMINSNGKHILSAKGESTLIDIKTLIKYKKTDILKELFDVLTLECKKKGAEFIWGFNNIPSSYKRLGFENPFKSHHAVLILKPFKAYKNISSLKAKTTNVDTIKTALRSSVAYAFSFKKLFIQSQKNKYHVNFELNDNSLLFRNASLSDKMIFLLQDGNYLKWRISKNPYPIVYRSFQLVDDAHVLVAQVICSIQKDVAFIEQTLFDRKLSKRNNLAFLKRIILTLQKENICMIRYTGFDNNVLNTSEMGLLKNLGFVFTGKGEWFTFKNLSGNSNINPKNIYLSRMYKQGVN